MAEVQNLVFIHGWGLNSAIWDGYIARLAKLRPDLSVFALDLPGYGHRSEQQSSSDLTRLAEHCLEQAPKKALWVGWSLGGLVAMRAAVIDAASRSKRIQALQLINTTPKFTNSEDWPCGVDLTTFQQFSRELAADYDRTLTLFLLLQAGANKGARQLANQAQSAICALPAPSAHTLMAGIECLAQADLRDELGQITVPTQIISGSKDRVTNPESSKQLTKLMREPHAEKHLELVELDCGHAPFLTKPDAMLKRLVSFIASVDQTVSSNESV